VQAVGSLRVAGALHPRQVRARPFGILRVTNGSVEVNGDLNQLLGARQVALPDFTGRVWLSPGQPTVLVVRALGRLRPASERTRLATSGWYACSGMMHSGTSSPNFAITET
jgi:hypothetical protein